MRFRSNVSTLVRLFCVACLCFFNATAFAQKSVVARGNAAAEHLWYEAENMRGFSVDELNNPLSNPSWANPGRAKAPGWGMNGPGVSAEWSQGGESEWNSAAASADETRAEIYQDVSIPRAGRYKIWLRYADWLGRTEDFTLRVVQGGREVFRREFGREARLAPHDETGMYWGWAFVWDGATTAGALAKGAARVSLLIERAAEARRHVDCFLITNDLAYVPEGRMKPEFAAARILREFSTRETRLAPLLEVDAGVRTPEPWRRPLVAGRDFVMPWNIAPDFWSLLDKPPAERPLYPFNAEPLAEFVAKYKGARDVPIFSSPSVVPVITLDQLTTYVQEGSPFLRHLRETRVPFAVVINYSRATMSAEQGQAAWKLLNGELRDQFIGWISGESIGYVWNAGEVAALKLSPAMSRQQLLEAYRVFYTRALERKWGNLFHTPETGAMWNKLIAAQATSSTAYAHALSRWGARVVGLETSAVQPWVAMRVAFSRGAARQYGASFLYYHAPNFGDTATTFTDSQNFAGPRHFFHTRYGATMGPSLSWYRKTYYLYYMAGASAIYLEQGHDQFFKPAPGEHPFQLNPLGRITDEFIRFAGRHTERGTPYTPVAFLLDPAHGWDMTDYPQWAFGVSPPTRHDRALRELFGAAYYPAPVNEGEPATADRQFFTSGIFGDIYDVLVASDERREAIDSYRAVVAGGRIAWTHAWLEQLKSYVRRGGVVVLNSAQAEGLTEDLLGLRLLSATREADDAACLLPGEAHTNLRGGVYAYERIEPRGAQVLMKTPVGDPLVTSFNYGRGRVIFCAVPDLLGLDERLAPAAAHLFAHLFAEAAPVRVRGDVQRLFNRNERGWLVTLINNRGVYKPQQGLAQVDRSAVSEVTLTLPRGQMIRQARELTLDAPLRITRHASESAVKINVPPGDVKIVELIEGR